MAQIKKMIQRDIEEITNYIPHGLAKKLWGKRVIVTGASGILGAYILEFLAHFAGEVIGVVNTDFPEHLNYLLEPSRYYPRRDSVKFLKIDLSQSCDLLPDADIIIHAAGYGQPIRFTAHPIQTIRLNTFTTMELFKRLRVGGKFLYVSSSELYNGGTPPFKEQDGGCTSPQDPRGCYIEAKRCGEAIVHAFRDQFDAKSVRISLLYGPGSRRGDTRVLNQFIEKAFIEKQIKMMDHGTAMRTYCYIKDGIHMMMLALLAGKEDQVYNIGGESVTTISQLAELIGQYTNVPVIYPETDKTLTGAPNNVKMDLTKIKTLVAETYRVPVSSTLVSVPQTQYDFKFTSLEEGLQKTIAWQKEWLYKEDKHGRSNFD